MTPPSLPSLRAMLAVATPLPWTHGEEHESKVEVVSNGIRVCSVRVRRGIASLPDLEANALLIPAAVNALPALLEVAEAAQRFLVDLDMGDTETGWEEEARPMRKALEALATKEGE